MASPSICFSCKELGRHGRSDPECVCVCVCVWVHGGMCLRNIGAALCKYSRRRMDVCAHLAAVHERLYRVCAPAVRARGRRRARGEARGDPTQTNFRSPAPMPYGCRVGEVHMEPSVSLRDGCARPLQRVFPPREQSPCVPH